MCTKETKPRNTKIKETKKTKNYIPAGEGEGDGLLHLDDDGLLLLVHVGGLGELDVGSPDVAGGGELDTLLGAADHHRLAKLGEIPAQAAFINTGRNKKN